MLSFKDIVEVSKWIDTDVPSVRVPLLKSKFLKRMNVQSLDIKSRNGEMQQVSVCLSRRNLQRFELSYLSNEQIFHNLKL
jgi:hypothetical protein